MSLTQYNGRRSYYGPALATAAAMVGSAYNRYNAPVVPTAVFKQVAKAAAKSARTRNFNRNTSKAKPSKTAKHNKSDIKKIKKQVRELKKYDDLGKGTHKSRWFEKTQITSADNAQLGSLITNGSHTTRLEAVITELKYYDPATGGLLEATTIGPYQRDISFKSVTATVTGRNNFVTECNYKLYLCKVKTDTTTSVTSAWVAGLSNQGSATGTSDLGCYPTDYSTVNDLWSLSVVSKGRLLPGQEFTYSHSEKNIRYDPSVTDTHTDPYQKSMKSFQFLCVIQGPVAHDSLVTGQVTYLGCGLDIINRFTYVIDYNAGTSLDTFKITNNLDTGFTNTGQVS